MKPIGRTPPDDEPESYPLLPPGRYRNDWPENYEPYAGLSYESVRWLLGYLGPMPPLFDWAKGNDDADEG